MDYKWEENLRELIEYINHNPDIIIRKGMVVIPPEKKTVFYDYFDRTGESFIKEYYGRFLIEAENLSLEYSSLEKQLITAKNKAHGNSLTGSSFLEAVKSKLVKPGIAKMEKIYLDEKLQMFLHQPLPCFTSLIFEELMNLFGKFT